MHIALFGGTFDPPHLGHIKMVKEVLEQNLFDEVWFLPVFEHQPKFQKNKMSSWEDRVEMLKTLLRQGFTGQVCEFEKNSGQQSYTHLALRKLSEKYSEHKFSWLMGSDQLSSLKYWKCDLHEACFPACANEFDYYVYPRAGFDIDLPYNNLKIIKNIEPVKLSSTKIRNLVRAGEGVEDFVSEEVGEYIREKKLYRN